MKRATKKEFKKADAILTADWHLQESTPVSRLDNFWETQWRKVDFISDLQKEHECPVIHSGDLFDYWKPSPMLLSRCIEHIPTDFYTVYGNHDLPQHNMDLAYKCGVNTLNEAYILKALDFGYWNWEPNLNCFIEFSDKKIIPWHVMTYQGKAPWPGCEAPKGAKLLKKYPEYDLIVTGDNHKPFVEEFEGRLLVNPGSIFRLTGAQENHKPRVYLWYSDTNTVTPVYLPIEEGVISREHLEVKKEREERLEAFVEALDDDFNGGVTFEDSLEKFFEQNDIKTPIKNIIYKALDDEKN